MRKCPLNKPKAFSPILSFPILGPTPYASFVKIFYFRLTKPNPSWPRDFSNLLLPQHNNCWSTNTDLVLYWTSPSHTNTYFDSFWSTEPSLTCIPLEISTQSYGLQPELYQPNWCRFSQLSIQPRHPPIWRCSSGYGHFSLWKNSFFQGIGNCD